MTGGSAHTDAACLARIERLSGRRVERWDYACAHVLCSELVRLSEASQVVLSARGQVGWDGTNRAGVLGARLHSRLGLRLILRLGFGGVMAVILLRGCGVEVVRAVHGAQQALHAALLHAVAAIVHEVLQRRRAGFAVAHRA